MTTLSELERRVTALEEQERARAFLRRSATEQRISELVRVAHADLSDPQMGELA